MCMDEGALWEGVVKGSREAFDQLYHEYSAPIRSFVRHYLEDPSAADDLVQETFLQLWKRPNGFNPDRGTLKQYLFGIARKRAAQWKRDAPPAIVEGRLENAMAHTADQMTSLTTVLQQLDHDQRAILWLREAEGYSYAELANILEIPIGTVKSRLFFAREALRHRWLGRREL